MNFADSITNVMAQLGYGGDKSAHSRYSNEHLTDKELLAAYRYAWLPRKLVDIPADDATRHWRKWNGTAEQVKRIKDIEKRIGLRKAVNEALKDARLFGNAAIMIHTDRTTIKTELRPDEIIEGLEVVEIPNTQGILARFNGLFRRNSDLISINGVQVHKSRLCIFRGRYVPRRQGGDSVLNSAYRALMDADSTSANINALVFECKVDVFKIPGLMELVGDPAYEQKLIRRLQIANHGKSVTNSLLMDAEEDYEQKQVTFSGVNDVLLTALQIAAGAANIPATKLLGESVSGLGSTGSSETRDYYDTIAGVQGNEIAPALANLDMLMQAEAGADIDYDWCSLWQESNSEKADNVGKLATAIGSLAATMLFPDDVLTDAAAQVLGDYMPALEITSDY